MTTSKRPKLELARKREDEHEPQAGSRGLSVVDAVKNYIATPGHTLAILRYFASETPAQTASALGISENVLNSYEKGESAPTLPDLNKFAKHFKADFRLLLSIFGHIGQDASETSMGIAAQFDGELGHREKADLRKLVDAFSKRSKS